MDSCWRRVGRCSSEHTETQKSLWGWGEFFLESKAPLKKNLKKYSYKSRNYLQFKIINHWTLWTLKALESELSANSLICHASCIWNLKLSTPAHLARVNVTVSQFLWVEDEYEKLQALKLLSVSESAFEKNMSYQIFISLPLHSSIYVQLTTKIFFEYQCQKKYLYLQINRCLISTRKTSEAQNFYLEG